MKAQYFSFDAIVASVIMIIAMATLASFWLSSQSIAESSNSPLYADALRIAEALRSPGSPSNWSLYFDLNQIRQFGFAKDHFSGQLDENKISRMSALAAANYSAVGRIMRAPANYYIVVEQTDNRTGSSYSIGRAVPQNATEVAIVYRGAILNGRPVRMKVYLWRN
ncbi:MAG: hypothetical protein N3G80_01085 [Candidatus Micrarchaeota archaeon]|nr:hypothetical protein [Candidatus Micrarchaeota archaeon]